MSTLYLTEQRSLVRREADYLVVLIPDESAKHARRRVEVPLIKIDQVVVQGDVTLTAPALHALLEARVEISFLTHFGQFRGRLSPDPSKNAILRVEQHRAHHDPEKRLGLARQFVRGKLANMRTMLLRQNRKLLEPNVQQGAERLKAAVASLDQANTVASLVGMEGAGSACYFGLFARLLRDDLGFRRRVRRPPTDPVNALLSYGYTILANHCASAVNTVGMDPFVGYLHVSEYGRPALALDLMEEFRPLVVDSVVLSLINNRELGPADFTEELGTVRLTAGGRRTFLNRLEERLNTPIMHPVFGYQATYKRCLELQTRLLAKFLTAEIPAYVPFLVR